MGELRANFGRAFSAKEQELSEAAQAQALAALAHDRIGVQAVVVAKTGAAPHGLLRLLDTQGSIAQRYDLQPGTCYLLRPDQHVAARWRSFDAARVRAAVARATGNPAASA